jgi:hypothetical protein
MTIQEKITQATKLFEEGRKLLEEVREGKCEEEQYKGNLHIGTYERNDGQVKLERTWDFQSKQALKLQLSLIKQLCPSEPRWVPKEEDDYFYYFWFDQKPELTSYQSFPIHFDRIAQGNCFPSTPEGKAACEEYGRVLLQYANSLVK